MNSNASLVDEIIFSDSILSMGINPADNTIFQLDSRYIDESKLNEFFRFQCTSAINIIHINCRSFNKNYCGIVNLLRILSKPLTAIAITETWLTVSNQDAFFLPGYNFVSQPRKDKTGGGVGIYINCDFVYKLRSDLCRLCTFIECIFIELPQKAKCNSTIIGCIYRPPNTDISLFNSEIVKILKIIDSENNKICLLAGDYNLDLMKCDSHEPTAEFLNNILSYSFYPSIKYPTRIMDTSATLIDNIFLNASNYNVSSAIVYSDISDHLPIILHLEINIAKIPYHNEIKKRAFTNEGLAKFNEELTNVENWYDTFHYCFSDENNTSIAYQSFTNQYKSIFDKHFPINTVKTPHRLAPRHPWMTKGLIRSCIKKSTLYKKYKKTGTALNKQRFLVYRKTLNRLLNVAEKSHYFELFKSASGNLRKTWRLINSLIGGTIFENSPESFIVDGNIITNKSEIADNFNKYFVDIGSRLAASIQPVSAHFSDYLKESYKDSFMLYPTDPAEIIRIVLNFENKSSAGYDEIPVKIMKTSIHAIAHPMSALINKSMHTGVFPDALKIARVCPIFKSGDKCDFLNYRPISILPSFSKIYEKVVFNRLLAYLDSKHILCDSQYGFRRNRSTYMSLIDLYDRISLAIDKREFSIGVFIDLSKAFDTLDHGILLRKLEHYGIRGVALHWFNSYLSNRKQCVTLNGATSSIQNIIYGVPQGSILGPLLFILYINDIVNCSDLLSFILFADDTTLVFSCKDLLQLNQIINEELAKVSDWLKANKLSLNNKKTNFILFGNKHTRSDTKFNIMIDGYAIEQVDTAKFLGVFIDAKLTWKKHIDYIALKISRGLAVMGRLRNTLPRNALLMLYYTMIYPYLTYCNLIWGSASPTVLRRLVCLQKRALRLITHSTFRSSSNPLFVSLKLLKLSDINIYQTAQFMFKVKHCLLPVSCLRYVTVADSKRYYETRNVHFFSMVGFRTVIRENGISIRGPRVWDSLTKEIQESNSLFSFKRALLKHLVASYETLN